MPKKKKLKHNPRVDQPRTTRREDIPLEENEEDYRNYTPLYMAVVFIIVVVVIVLLFAFVFNIEAETVAKYDEVKLDYEIYSYDQYENHEDPEIKKTNTWVNVCHRYDDDCEDCNCKLVKGFYEKLLGKKEGDIIDDELIEGCVDKDEDGEDDQSGEDALSYGFESDPKELRYEDIVIWCRVIEINKTSDEEETEESSLAKLTYAINSPGQLSLLVHYVIFDKLKLGNTCRTPISGISQWIN